jgi:hypothetical protein
VSHRVARLAVELKSGIYRALLQYSNRGLRLDTLRGHCRTKIVHRGAQKSVMRGGFNPGRGSPHLAQRKKYMLFSEVNTPYI